MSTNLIPVIEEAYHAYVVTPNRIVDVVEVADTPEEAASALRRVASPDSVKCAFVLIDTDYDLCEPAVKALQNAGYTGIESIDMICINLSRNIFNLPLKCAIGEPVFIYVDCPLLLADSFVEVIVKTQTGWRVVARSQEPAAALAKYRSVRNIVTPERSKAKAVQLFPGRKCHVIRPYASCFKTKFIYNRINGGNLDGYEVLPCCDLDLFVLYGNKHEKLSLLGHPIPFCVEKEIDIGDISEVKVSAYSPNLAESPPIFKTLKFKKSAFRKIAISVTVSRTLYPQVTLRTVSTYKPADQLSSKRDVPVKVLAETTSNDLPDKTANAASTPPTSSDTVKAKKSRSQRRKLARLNAAKNGKPEEGTDIPRLSAIHQIGSIATLSEEVSKLDMNPTPKVVLTFTSDNRVLIKGNESYTGSAELLAYVRLEAGKPPIVGQLAYDALESHPHSVFYDITRLLASDFDPDYPDPNWAFKTARDADGKVVIHAGDNVTTFPIVLFGIVVKSMLLYIRDHMESDVSCLAVVLPASSVVSKDELKKISQLIGIEVVLC